MLRLLALLTAVLIFNSHAELVVKNAEVRLLPPGVPNTSAYFYIENDGIDDEIIIGATSDIAQTVEIHQHIMHADTMKMVHLQELTIPAKESVNFNPGGLHLMLFGLVKPLEDGQTVTLSLQTQSGQAIKFNAIVAKP